LEVNPNKINTLINCAGVLAQLGRKTDAIEILSHAHEITKSNGDTVASAEIERHLRTLNQ